MHFGQDKWLLISLMFLYDLKQILWFYSAIKTPFALIVFFSTTW